jgi:hypothetical protein
MIGHFCFTNSLDLELAFEKARQAGLVCDLQDFSPPYLLRVHFKNLKVAVSHTGKGTFAVKPGVSEKEFLGSLQELFEVLQGKVV